MFWNRICANQLRALILLLMLNKDKVGDQILYLLIKSMDAFVAVKKCKSRGRQGIAEGWHQRRPFCFPVKSAWDAKLTYLRAFPKYP